MISKTRGELGLKTPDEEANDAKNYLIMESIKALESYDELVPFLQEMGNYDNSYKDAFEHLSGIAKDLFESAKKESRSHILQAKTNSLVKDSPFYRFKSYSEKYPEERKSPISREFAKKMIDLYWKTAGQSAI